MKPFVSVVVPSYNSRFTLPECLDSLGAQSYPRDRYEVILSDNGSTDGSLDFIRQNYPWVVLVETSQAGSGYARNAGIRAARGEFILSTDSDCVADKDWVLMLVSTLEQASPKVAAVGGRIAPFSLATIVERYPHAWICQPKVLNGSKLDYAATPNVIFRKSIFLQVGGFDGPLFFVDSDLGIRLRSAGFEIDYEEQAVVRHRNPCTFRELYRHRVKYGAANFALAKKHPGIFEDPEHPGAIPKLILGTTRRIVGDLFIKLPASLVIGKAGYTRVWPLVDATMALGILSGFLRASKSARAGQSRTS